jgi:hypothetical protein
MGFYRKKPVVVEAFQMTEDRRRDSSEWPEWLNAAWQKGISNNGALYPKDHPFSDGTDPLMINTLEGMHEVSWNDYIIKGVDGELYPCKPGIFKKTYELVVSE